MSDPAAAAAAATENHCGVDVSKATPDARLPDVAGRATARRFDNDDAGVGALVDWPKPFAPGRVVREATGRYGRHAAAAAKSCRCWSPNATGWTA